MDKYLTTDAAATYLGVTAARVRQLILEDKLPSEKNGRDHLIMETSLKAYVRSGRRKPGRPKK